MPSRCTVHAPQRAAPQPNLVPFMPRRSRKTHSNGMSGDASTLWDLPLIFNVTMIDVPRTGRPRTVQYGHRARPPVADFVPAARCAGRRATNAWWGGLATAMIVLESIG